jgi:hypothetical protein
MLYRTVQSDDAVTSIIAWANSNNAPLDTRVRDGHMQIGMPMYFWRKAEYVGLA